ncbi:ABC transporter permease [Roseiarcus sp.]|uniref:ABC transporter permease n=1 Tax=Roseiarcus sp. TaxID=1969460 RepID=UPI003F993DBD
MSAGSAVTPSHFRGWIASNALPIAILAIVIVFSAAQPAFIGPDNLIGIVQQVALVGIMATCTTFVIMTGGVDLSVGPVLAAAGLVSYYALEAGLPLALVILAGLSIGALVGLANGATIAFLELPPIIVTLAMLSIARGSALILGGPGQHLIREQPEYSFIGAGNLFGLPVPVYIFVLVALVMIFVQRRTPLGLLVAAIGDNERAAYLSGHRTRGTKTLVYVISGLGAALAGIIQSSQVHTALATYGPFGTELDVIAAVVLGGTSIMGGNGSIPRTLLGVFFLGVVNDGMNILNVPIDIQLMAKGAIIVAALGFAARRN